MSWGVAALVVASLLLGAVGPWIAAALSGNLDVPHNDAWSYSRIAETFSRTGRLELLDWNRSPLIGQLVVLAPFGGSLFAQQTAVALLAGATLVLVFVFLRAYLGKLKAAFVTLVISIWPGFALLATSYMADIPAMFGVFACLAVGALGLRRRSRGLLIAALILGAWAVSIRSQSLAAPVALIVAACADRESRRFFRWRFLIPCLIVSGACAVAVTVWHDRLPNSDSPSYAVAPQAVTLLVSTSLQWIFTTAFALLPIVLAAVRPLRWTAWSWIAAVASGAIGIVWADRAGSRQFFVGNYLSADGAYAGVTAGERVVIDHALWLLVVALAILSFSLAAGHLVAARRLPPALPFTFLAITVVGNLATVALGQPTFDRYLLVIAPVVSLWILAPVRAGEAAPTRARPVRWAVIGMSTAVLALVSCALAGNAWSFDTARWHAAARYESRGVPASRIDAGLEWLGWHSPDGVTNRNAPFTLGWELTFSSEPSCVVIGPAMQSGPGWTRDASVPYTTYLISGTSHLAVFRTHAAGCDS